MITEDQLRQNITNVRARIEAACQRAGRDPSEATLLPVTKTHPPELVEMLQRIGMDEVGENRVQELRDKHRWFGESENPQPKWHFIGNLQKNKIKYLLTTETSVFHALDSAALAGEIERVAERRGGALECLLEINVSGEASKHGIAAEEAEGALRQIVSQSKRVQVTGLMTMAPFADNPEQTRPVFRGLRELRDRLQDSLNHPLPVLSMGMTNDFEVAIEEGATLVRVGTALFGPREKRPS